MDALQIRNLKSIVNSGEISIKPITVFVGQNSSGKSSLIRCFPLFKQSAESKTLGTVLWTGKYVDYGSFDEALNQAANEKGSKEISFSFTFKLANRGRVLSSPDYERVKLKIDVSGDEYSKNSYSNISFEMHGNIFSLKITPDLKIISVHINGTDFSKQASDLYRAYKIYTIIPVLLSNARSAGQPNTHYSTLFKEIKRHVHHRTSDEKIRRIARNLRFSDDESIKRSLTNKALVGDYAAAKIANWSITDPDFKTIKDQIILFNLENIIDNISDNFRAQFLATRYITPLRAAADRYYRIQNTSIEEMDPNGSNLAMFLRAKTELEIEEINSWLENEIGFSIEIFGSHGHASIFIIDQKSKRRTNIADTGFGISQILPVLIQVWQLSKKRTVGFRQVKTPTTIIIEQPELHLHPKMQSRLGETFCNAIKLARMKEIDLRIIIETHSKDIIDSIGRSIESGTIDKDDAAIYILNKDENATVSRSYFDEDGYLMQWPYGFFDGA